jgi:hypothetical protein
MKMFYVVLLLMLSAVAGFAQTVGVLQPKQEVTQNPSTQHSKPDVVLDKLVFPEVNGWKRGDVSPLPTDDDGVFVHYDSPSSEWMTVYIYRRGATAKNNLSGVAKEEFEDAKDALRTVTAAGMYSDLKESTSGTTVLGEPGFTRKALHAAMSFRAQQTPLTADLYVFPYRGYVVKLRVTRLAELGSETDAAHAELLSAINKMFSK